MAKGSAMMARWCAGDLWNTSMQVPTMLSGSTPARRKCSVSPSQPLTRSYSLARSSAVFCATMRICSIGSRGGSLSSRREFGPKALS